jgi:DNA-binding response OmpR family regulator
MRNPGQILSQTQLLDLVWGYDFDGASNVVETYIRHLRARSGQTGSRPCGGLATGWSIGEIIAAGADRRHCLEWP